MPQELIVSKTIRIHATARDIWKALTDPDLTERYMHNSRVVSDWKVGSPIFFTGLSDGKETMFVKGEIVKYEPFKVLAFTCFGPQSGLPDIPANYTTVTYELHPDEADTLVLVTQGDFATVADGEKRYKETLGGWDYALIGLKTLLEIED